MSLSFKDAGDLGWYFGEGLTRFQRSTFGVMLERAEQFGFDSEGNQLRRPDDPWSVMSVKHAQGEPSYEVELRDLHRFGDVSRRLLRVAERDPLAALALELLYGDIGQCWARERGLQMACLYPLTETGKRVLAGVREQDATRAHVRDDQVIVDDVDDQAAHPNDVRRRRHEVMRGEADLLKARAWSVWDATRKGPANGSAKG
jgi:hypothetical protein